jgi:hypothetical protein
MRMPLVAIAMLALTTSLAGCGGTSTNASRDCFAAWNAAANKTRQSTVADRFRIASVREWRAEAVSGTVNLGGPASKGCGYLFHTSKAYLSISGEWKGGTIRWGVPPPIHGSWSPEQQAAVSDNAAVEADGLLSHRQ